MTLKNYVINETINLLPKIEGHELCPCDIPGEIPFDMDESREHATTWIDRYWDIISDINRNWMAAYGISDYLSNVSEDPAMFKFEIVQGCCERLLGRCKSLFNGWDTEKITLTKEVIGTICRELEEQKTNDYYDDFYKD